MVRNTAREIAAHLSYELSFTDKTVDELLKERLTPEAFAELAEEDPLYADAPNAKQAAYITRLVKGVDEHAAELDGYIAKYSKGWKFSRIPLVASAIMRVAMYEILYMEDIPNGAAINEAWRLPKSTKRRRRPNSSTAFWQLCTGGDLPVILQNRQSGRGAGRRPLCLLCYLSCRGGYLWSRRRE